jgi:L-ascorbate metabolism protein UlaG (beta-lactamase superfamily)
MSTQLEFVGHACFRLWEDGRPTVVMDPYGFAPLGLADPGKQLEADTVIVSSLTDSAHNNVGLVSGSPRVINALDVALGQSDSIDGAINGAPIVAIPAKEDPNHSSHDPMDNAMYAFQAGGLWIAHLGDLGYGLTEAELAPWVGKCDVLLAITGEKNTVKLADLAPMIDFLAPRWIVPMHYGLPPVGGTGFQMQTVDVFLNAYPRAAVYIPRHHTITLPPPPASHGVPTIVVLEPSGYTPTGGVPVFTTSAVD